MLNIKKIIIISLLILVTIFGGRAIYNYSQYGDIRGKEYVEENDQKNLWKSLENKLTEISDRVNQSNSTLWETLEGYQQAEDVCSPHEELTPPENIVELVGKIKSKFITTFIDFGQQLSEETIKFSELSDKELDLLKECVKIGEKENKLLKEGGFFNEEKYQIVQMSLKSCSEKIKEEKERRLLETNNHGEEELKNINSDFLRTNYLKNATIALDKMRNSETWQEVLSKYRSTKVAFSLFKEDLEIVKVVNEIRKEFLMVCVDFCQKENEKETKFNNTLKEIELRHLEEFAREGKEVNKILFGESKYGQFNFNKTILSNYHSAVMEEIERRGEGMKKVKTPLVIKEKFTDGAKNELTRLVDGETDAYFEIEDERMVIPLQIKKFVRNNYRQKWERKGREYAAYIIETPIITTLWKGGKEIKITDLAIVWKDKNNEIPDIDDILREGAEIKLKLGKNLEESEESMKEWHLKEEGDWKEGGNNTFSLEVFSNYEIITPNRKIKFN